MGFSFLKEEKEEVWEDNHADFADHDLFGHWGWNTTPVERFYPPGVQADLQSAFKKCPNLFGICGFGIRSRQECCCWIRAHTPSSFFWKRRNLYIFAFLGSRGRSWYGFSENGREKRKRMITMTGVRVMELMIQDIQAMERNLRIRII